MAETGLQSTGRSLPTADRARVSWIDSDQMIEIDRIMIEDLGISLVQMMENAGRNLADLAMASDLRVSGKWLRAYVSR